MIGWKESPEKVGVVLRKTHVGVWLEQQRHVILEMMKITKITKTQKTPSQLVETDGPEG